MALIRFSVALVVAAFAGAEPQKSPVDSRISAAEVKVHSEPNSAAAWNDLAAALCRKGRDSEDLDTYEEAKAALGHSFRLSKSDYEARKLQVAVLLGKHEFANALQLASDLNHQAPDDLAGWAFLVDANIALGNYAAAESQAQWVLDLRPGNALGFQKAAELREQFGDLPGAIEFFDEANRRTAAGELDQRAFLLTEKARLQLSAGYSNEAEQTVQQALQLFPDSLRATEILAEVRSAHGDSAGSAHLFEKRYRAVRSSRNLYQWAEALDSNGQKAEAAERFADFEKQAEAESAKPFNANVQLVFYNIERKHQSGAALALAARMSADRHDARTLDAYAWALYANGKYFEAKTQMDRALAVGVRNPVYFCRAAQIAEKAADATAATQYRKEVASFKGVACPAKVSELLTSSAGKQDAP